LCVLERSIAKHKNWPTYNQWNLQERGKLVLLLYRGFRVHNTAQIIKHTIAAHQDIIGDCVAENFNIQNVGNDFLSFLVQIGMDQSDVVVAGDHVAQRRQTLLDASNLNGIGQAVANVLQLLVRGGIGHEQTVSIARCETPDYATLANARVHHGNVVGQLALKDTF
jgi:hypothetical protein